MIFGGDIRYLPLVLIAVVISIVLHEIAHGYVALLNGDPTAKINGRLTLNPFAHFNFFGLLMMVMVGFGFANPVPVNPNYFRKKKVGVFTVAIAGVSVNFILAFICAPFLIVFLEFARMQYVAEFFLLMMLINIGLMLFNLLPIYPLDGFRIIEAFTYHTNKLCRFMRNYGIFILIGLIFLGRLIDSMTASGRFPNWINYFDILGHDLILARNAIFNLIMAFWNLIFGTAVRL